MPSVHTRYGVVAIMLMVAIAFALVALALNRWMAPSGRGSQDSLAPEYGGRTAHKTWVQFRARYPILALLFVATRRRHVAPPPSILQLCPGILGVLEATMRTSTRDSGILRFVGLFVVAASLNYPWELAQAPLFVQTQEWGAPWWHCLVASLGDGIFVWMIYVIGWAVFGRPDWFEYPRWSEYTLMLTTGALIAVVVEWVALHLAHRWAYSAKMPLLPGLNIGLIPILQMLLLPPVIFRLVAAWPNRHKR